MIDISCMNFTMDEFFYEAEDMMEYLKVRIESLSKEMPDKTSLLVKAFNGQRKYLDFLIQNKDDANFIRSHRLYFSNEIRNIIDIMVSII